MPTDLTTIRLVSSFFPLMVWSIIALITQSWIVFSNTEIVLQISPVEIIWDLQAEILELFSGLPLALFIFFNLLFIIQL